jgi:hypothetical protein
VIDTVIRCDVPTCHSIIPEHAKRYETRLVLTLVNGDKREAFTARTLCSQACVLATVSELMRAVSGATVGAVAGECHSIRMED